MFCGFVGLKNPTELKKLKLSFIYFMVDLYCNGHGVIVFLNLAQMWASAEAEWPISHCKEWTWNRTVQDRSWSLWWPHLVPWWSGLAKCFAVNSRDPRTSWIFHSQEDAGDLEHHAHATPALKCVPADQRFVIAFMDGFPLRLEIMKIKRGQKQSC